MSSRTKIILLLALAALGLADAAYLTLDHFWHMTDQAYAGGLCGTDGGCSISRTSAWSEIPFGGGPGIPISMTGCAFYIVFALLLIWPGSNANPEARDNAWRIRLSLATLATLYSITLAVVSLITSGGLCKFCSGLYIINLLLLILTFRQRDNPMSTWFDGLFSAAFSKVGLVAAVVFVGLAAAAFSLYAPRVTAAQASDILAQPKVQFDLPGRPSKGPADAPVQLIEFADLQCPHCKRLFDTLEAVQAKHPDDLRVTFIHFPLDMACNPAVTREFHKHACYMAQLTTCADAQGKFSEATKVLIDGERGRTAPELRRLLVDADAKARWGLDFEALDACAASPETMATIQAGIHAGIEANVRGTPAWFINGHRGGGARPADYFEALIARILRNR